MVICSYMALKKVGFRNVCGRSDLCAHAHRCVCVCVCLSVCECMHIQVNTCSSCWAWNGLFACTDSVLVFIIKMCFACFWSQAYHFANRGPRAHTPSQRAIKHTSGDSAWCHLSLMHLALLAFVLVLFADAQAKQQRGNLMGWRRAWFRNSW